MYNQIQTSNHIKYEDLISRVYLRSLQKPDKKATTEVANDYKNPIYLILIFIVRNNITS